MGLAMVMAAAVCTMTGCVGGKTVDLNEYLYIDYSGYDTLGKASCEIDYEQMARDYSDKMKLKGDAAYFGPAMILADGIDGELDKTRDLSNGDKIKFTWEVYEEDLKEVTGLKFKYSDVEQKIEGLEKVQPIDAFEGVNLSFEGTSPQGKATVQAENAPMSADSYRLDTNMNLKNGDVVTVTIDESACNSLCESQGMIPKERTREFTVEGLSEYVNALSDIDDTLLAQMQQQAADESISSTARYEHPASYKGEKYLGSYLLTSKTTGENKIYLVYEKTYQIADRTEDNIFNWIWYIEFDNIIKNGDGTYNVDLNNYKVPSGTAFFGMISGEDVGFTGEGGADLFVSGFADLESFVREHITAHMDAYNYETTLN